MYLMPVFAALSTIKFHKSVTNLGWFLLAFFFILIIGLRFEVGIDWFNSVYSFNKLTETSSLTEAVLIGRFEPFYAFITWVLGKLDISIWGINLIGIRMYSYRSRGVHR